MEDILLTVIFVNYKVPEYLSEALRSLRQAECYDKTEVIIIDNASRDNSQKLITSEFQEVRWIQLKNNLGFGKACNIGVNNARGKYILFLNPDTVIAANTLSLSIAFMEKHEKAGLMGPKILNPDGSLQASCRRSLPTPAIAFFHFSGLSRLFPRSKLFGRYNLTFMDPDKTAQVDAVSGSFMLIPTTLFREVGGFDEKFFLYGEDLDLCYRIREKGYEIWYYPETQIIHRKGKSSAKHQFSSRIAFYEAMLIFSKKYRHIHRSFFPGQLIYLGILIQAVLNLCMNIIRNATATIIDLAIINITLWVGIILRFASTSETPYNSDNFLVMPGLHLLLSICFLFMFVYNGIYSKNRYSISNTLFSGLLASVLFMAIIFFIKPIAVSRIVFAFSTVVVTLLLVSWRELIPRITKRFRRLIYTPDKILVVGNSHVSELVIKSIEEQKLGVITGIIYDGATSTTPGEYLGYPVLGSIDDLKNTMKDYQIDILLIATPLPWYSQIINIISTMKVKRLTIRWVPHELFDKTSEELPSEIPLLNFSV